MTKQQRWDAYEKLWSSKTKAQVEKELASYRKYLSRHKDSFFKESAPSELSDGDRITILREILDGNLG